MLRYKRKKSQFKEKVKTQFKNQSYKSRQTDIFWQGLKLTIFSLDQ